jgi:hypothetical protein
MGPRRGLATTVQFQWHQVCCTGRSPLTTCELGMTSLCVLALQLLILLTMLRTSHWTHGAHYMMSMDGSFIISMLKAMGFTMINAAQTAE